jgi:hypothetical protein
MSPAEPGLVHRARTAGLQAVARLVAASPAAVAWPAAAVVAWPAAVVATALRPAEWAEGEDAGQVRAVA